MLLARRLAGLPALGAHYAGVKWRAMRGGRSGGSTQNSGLICWLFQSGGSLISKIAQNWSRNRLAISVEPLVKY